MPTINGNGKKMIKGLFWVPVLLVGVSAATYTLVIPEPAKLLLLGAFLIGLAFWGKKQLVDNGLRTTDYRTTDNGTGLQTTGPQTTGHQTTDRLQSVEREAQSAEQNQEAASSMQLAAKR